MNKSTRALIVGAGPIGSYFGAKISKDIETTIYEEHKIIGKPVQCTGIITGDIKSTMKLGKDIVLNKIKYANIHSNEEIIKLPVNDYIVDRTLFDKTLYHIATKNGATVKKWNKIDESFLKKEIKKTKQDEKLHIIGADGPTSIVSRKLVKNKPQKVLTGVQYVIKGNFDKDKYDVFFDKNISKDFFGWIVPENEYVARIGLAGSRINKHNFENLKKCLEKQDIEITKNTIVRKQGGIIPIYSKDHLIQRRINDNTSVSLIGDAGAFVKATTGGGIIPGLESARILSKAILNDDVYSYSSTKNKDLRKINNKLKIHLFLHNYLRSLKDGELDILLRSIKDKKSFENINRDNIISLLRATALKNPKLVLNAIKFML